MRAVPDGEHDDHMRVPKTTIVHGEKKEGREQSLPAEQHTGLLQLNGTRVLFSHGYYGTCALRAKEVFRLYPEFARQIDARLRVAAALEKLNLYGEALAEYRALSHEELSHRDKVFVNEAGLRFQRPTKRRLARAEGKPASLIFAEAVATSYSARMFS